MAYIIDENSRVTHISPLQQMVYQIVYKIRNEHNFEAAADILLGNQLTVEQVATTTIRLSLSDIAKLADAIIKKKN